ncbi:MAG: WGR domain-containing protein [Rubripirellula sp.]
MAKKKRTAKKTPTPPRSNRKATKKKRATKKKTSSPRGGAKSSGSAKKPKAKKRTSKSATAGKGSRSTSAGGKRAAKKTSATPPRTTTRSRVSAAYREPKVLESPSFQGRPEKLPRDTYPEGSIAKDFVCYGPAATKDGELESVRICDLGCFAQDGKDSNKYYHGAVVQHRKSKNWYTYFEWGRTGARTCCFQFIACQCETDARATFAKQLHAKNDKRGEWVTIAGIRTLRAKKGKDCYLVRPMATRTTGLPDARNIKVGRKSPPSNSKPATPENEGDPVTMKLLRDMRVATIRYTRQSMADSSVPTQVAVDEARTILDEARTRIAEIDDDVDSQVGDRKLMQLTRLMFSRIPRKKRVGAAPLTWMLTQNNIQDWHDDLDAFESALHAVDIELHPHADILGEMNLEMEWIDPASKVGKSLYKWWPDATAHRHQRMKQMSIKNLWAVNQRASGDVIPKAQQRILKGKLGETETPRHQPRTRVDVPVKQRGDYKDSNTALLLHGTRSVNVNAILRESLRMPETLVAVALTGAKFGPGIYFSDDWKKAADYTNAKGSAEAGKRGAVKGRHAFMFAADVVLGRPHVAKCIQGFTKPPRGHHSVFGKAGHSGVDDNEFVVYKTDQSKLRYLIEFKTS